MIATFYSAIGISLLAVAAVLLYVALPGRSQVHEAVASGLKGEVYTFAIMITFAIGVAFLINAAVG